MKFSWGIELSCLFYRVLYHITRQVQVKGSDVTSPNPWASRATNQIVEQHLVEKCRSENKYLNSIELPKVML